MVPLGLSGLAGTLAVAFTPYRNWFILFTVLLLGLSHFLLWRQQNRSPKAKKLLWTATYISAFMIIYTLVSRGF